jgi:hypothetical protein
MQIIAFHYTKMARELAALRAAVSSTVEFVLGHSLDETLRMKVVDELVAEFWKLEERCSRLERPGMRIYDLLLRPPYGQARLADRLEEAPRRLGTELAVRWEADVELEAQQASAAWVRDLVLDGADKSSSLATSLSTAVELLEGRIDAAEANEVCWGTRSVLVATLSHSQS